MSDEQHPWTRRPDESTPAYEAFRSYMRLRNITQVAPDIGKSLGLVKRWSSTHDWVERMRAYDTYLSTSQVESVAEEMAKVRNKHMAITDKLLDHLDRLLDELIANMRTPGQTWTMAFVAATKAQEAAMKLRPVDTSQSERVEAVLKKMAVVFEGIDDGME